MKSQAETSPIVLQKTMGRYLTAWFEKHARSLPWRTDKEPYHVWLSEIMLQQTRVAAVISYYNRFLASVPSIAALAAEQEDILLKLWEGLGYYSRVRNMQKAARQIMTKHHGIFPDSYDAIGQLQGIGPYTAGAIASICFNLPTPAVDGNVLRVIARVSECSLDIAHAETKKQFQSALKPLYETEPDRSSLTQSLMELGALICLPNSAPNCAQCPLQSLCNAYRQGTTAQYPFKSKQASKQTELLTVFVLQGQGHTALLKRQEPGLLSGLWQLPAAQGHFTEQQAEAYLKSKGFQHFALHKSVKRKHIFTHKLWDMTGYYFQVQERPPVYTWASETELQELYALPTAFKQFLSSLLL